MNREGSIVTIAAAIFLSWFVFRKSLNNKNKKNPKNRAIPPPITANITTTSASESSTAADLAGKYEVFLSFRGTDTREGFTDFLYTYLIGASIRTFRDDNELRIGEEIGPDLLKAIKDSKIYIPVFSKNYAFSKWCLRELAEMVECHTNEGQKIFPIFYDVDAYNVRNQKGSYEKAFRQHEKNFDEKTVQEWRQALKTVGQLKGYELEKETNGREGELVKKVVRNVLFQLKKNYTHVPDDLVGMDHHIENMTRLLHANSDGVRIVGIHGMGGIGKTTIAKVIYNQLCEKFECCCFLEDIREKAKQHHDGVVNLQKQLVSQLLRIDLPVIVDVDEGINKIKDGVHRKNVLIVLDDVDEKSQFDKFAGECTWFDKASRIIITTRNKEVLNALDVTCRKKGLLEAYKSYEPELMNPEHSLQLFSKYAFMRDSPPEDYFILSKEVVSTAAGLPLVLVTLGSLFFGNEDKDLWKEKLRELEKIPDEEVLRKLRISFEALNHCQKRIFLDIACLFIGEDKENPYYMWDDCDFYPKNGVNTLVLRSLVKVGDDNTLRMHDHLRDLGRQIVREENFDEPGERSRVWHPDEALDVLKGGLGTKNVEALNLDFGAVEQDEFEQLESYGDRLLVGQEFEKLRSLRFLRVGYANLGGDFKNLLSNLRWLQWSYRGKFTPKNFHMKNLVILDLSGSHSTITDDWEGWSQFKMATKVKVLNLSYCRGLSTGPNFSTFTTLERLIFKSTLCEEINPSIKNLRNLRVLDLVSCKYLETLDCSAFEALDSLDLRSCESLLEINGLEKLESLTYLNISFCRSLKRLPNLSNLKKLKELVMRYCPKVTEVQGADKLESLKVWNIRRCILIERLPRLSNLRNLKELNLRDCSKLREIEEFGDLDSLEILDMRSCKSLERLPDFSNLKKLKTLCLCGCKNLYEVEGLGNLESLESLDLSSCVSLEKTLDLSKLKKLKNLDLRNLDRLAHIVGVEELESLESLDVSNCRSIEKLPDFSKLKNLKDISANECEKLAEIRGLEELKFLTSLEITGCKSLENLPHLPNTKIWQMYKDYSEFFG